MVELFRTMNVVSIGKGCARVGASPFLSEAFAGDSFTVRLATFGRATVSFSFHSLILIFAPKLE